MGPGSLITTGLISTNFALGPSPGQGTEEFIWIFSLVSSQGVISSRWLLVSLEMELRTYGLPCRCSQAHTNRNCQADKLLDSIQNYDRPKLKACLNNACKQSCEQPKFLNLVIAKDLPCDYLEVKVTQFCPLSLCIA